MKFAFNAWGRTLALAGGYLAINGGIVNFFYSNPSETLCTICGAYCVAVGVLIYLFLYPLKLGSWWLGPILWIVNFNHLPLGIALILYMPHPSPYCPQFHATLSVLCSRVRVGG